MLVTSVIEKNNYYSKSKNTKKQKQIKLKNI